MTYLYLVLAIVFEVGWAIGVKELRGFAPPIRVLPTVVTAVMYILSLVFLALATRTLDISIAYALWAGTGAALIAVAGIVWYREPATTLKVASLVLVIAGVVGLNLAGSGHSPSPPPGGSQSGTPTAPTAP